MTNLDQVCLFSNLITTPVQWCGFGVGVMRAQLFFYWFQGRNLLGDDQNFKRVGDAKKGESQISRGQRFFLFYQSQVLSHFVPVSPDTTLKERSLG